MTAIGKTQVLIWGFYHVRKNKFKNGFFLYQHIASSQPCSMKSSFVVQLDEPGLESDENVVY